VHAEPERLPHGLLRGEAARVVLGRVRLRFAVGPFGLGEAAFAEAVAVALQRAADPRDLDQVDADADSRQRFLSSHSGSCAIEETIPSGETIACSRSSGRNLPVRTSTVRMPIAWAPTMSPSRSSPTTHVSSGSESIASIAAWKYAGLGLPRTIASMSDAY